MGIIGRSVKNYRINTVSPTVMIVEARSPTTADNNFDIGTEWLDNSSNKWFKLSAKPSGVAAWIELGTSSASVTDIDVDASTPPGTDPVVPNASNFITMTGGQVATGTIGANVIRTNSLAANTLTVEIQRTTTAASADSSLNGVCHFDSGTFSVDSDGFVTLAGGSAAIDSFIPDSGTSPVVPNGAGQVTMTGTQGLSFVGGSSTLTVQSDNGQLATDFLVSSGTSPVVPDASGQITLTDGNGVGMTGGTNAITFDMVSPFTGDFTFTDSTAADTETLTVSNTDNTAASASGAQVAVNVGGTTQIGDPYISFGTGSSIAYSVGSDTDSSQDFKINTDAASSVTPSSGTEIFLMNSSSDVSFNTLSLGHAPPEIDTSFTINGSALSSLLSVDAEGATDLGGIIDHRHSDTAAFGAHYVGLRSRGTHGSESIVQDDDVLSRFLACGYDGTDYAQSAEIRGEVDGTPGANDMPGRWVFLTSADGAQAPTEALRLDSSQDATFTADISTTGGSVTIDPGAATDSFLQYDESTTGKWRTGNDATDDSYRISQGSALGTNDTFIMTSSGERTMPLQPAFLAYLGTEDTSVTGDGTSFQIGSGNALTEIFDQNGDFNTNGTFTAPITGRYMINIAVALANLGAGHTACSLQIVTSNNTYTHGSVSAAAIRNSGNFYHQAWSQFVDMDAMDTAIVNIIVSNSTKTVNVRNNVVAADKLTTIAGWLVC